MAYTGTSIVDYLKSQNKPSDFTTRAGLAAQQGIQGYTGSASQNTQLLQLLNQGTASPPTQPTASNRTIQSGETLSGIASGLGTTTQDLLKLNPQITNPDLIYAGANINLPGAQTGFRKDTNYVSPTTPTPKPFDSQIDAGKDFISSRTERGLPADEVTLKRLYRNYGLEGNLGPWVGSVEQYKAMAQHEKIQSEIADKQIKVQELIAQMADAQAAEDAKTAAETASTTGTTTGDVDTTTGDTTTSSIMTGGSVNVTNPEVADTIKMDSTDIAEIMNEISSGEFLDPMLSLDEAENELEVERIKSETASALATLQQNMAQRGLSFSGIRTKAEEDLAAQSLAAMTGLGIDLTRKVITAARQEQTRRIDVIKFSEQQKASAFAAMGFVMNPFTGKLEETLEAKEARAKAGEQAYQRQLDQAKLQLDTISEQRLQDRLGLDIASEQEKAEVARQKLALDVYKSEKPEYKVVGKKLVATFPDGRTQVVLDEGTSNAFGFDKDTLESFNEELMAIADAGSRVQAIEDLNRNQTTLFLSYGSDPTQFLYEEVERLYPPSQEFTPEERKEAGKAVGEEVGKSTSGIFDIITGKTTAEPGGASEGFWGGVFQGLLK